MLSTIKSELLKYGETTSVRGISKMIKSKDIFTKILWLLFFVVSTGVMIFLLVTLYQKFSTWPVNTKYGENRNKNISFPDLTLCNLDIFAEGQPEELSVSDYLSYVKSAKNNIRTSLENNNSNDEAIRDELRVYERIFEELYSVSGYVINLRKDRPPSEDCPNFIVDCKVFNTKWQRSDVACSAENFTRQWDVNYYTCYTLRTSNLNISGDSKIIRGIILILNVGPPTSLIQVPFKQSFTNSQARGVQVSVHSPGTPADLKRGFSVAPGTENIVDIVQTDKTRLSEPYNPYVIFTDQFIVVKLEKIYKFESISNAQIHYLISNKLFFSKNYCENFVNNLANKSLRLGCTSRTEMPNSPSERYSYNFCLEYCLQGMLKRNCNCVSNSLAVPNDILNDTVLCENFSALNIIEKKIVEDNKIFELLFKLKCSLLEYFFFTEYDRDCVKNCLLPCDETVYDVFTTSASWPQPSTQVDIFNKYFVKPGCLNKNPKVRSRYSNYLKLYYDHLNDTSVEISQSNMTQIKESLLEIKFVMKQNFPYYQTESAAYTWDVMIGTVGGMLSLWLGITVASAVEIVELLYLLVKSYHRKRSSGSARINSVANTENSDVVESNFVEKIKN
ncbi:hypothetical protein HELRODRAFT_167218 [Helobdella robusta]|uniref:Uncharacterized protein n=1 Tax=Helobdella robusta TaxID=6412 RepID=T1EZ56_HELRO|nr:hypothetical protein HELRODRAFT_167218 [Helobdella robusta]ESO10724.1 hypothetical protein HELRODRAFT_167218 [Helobdella robusta]